MNSDSSYDTRVTIGSIQWDIGHLEEPTPENICRALRRIAEKIEDDTYRFVGLHGDIR